MKNFFILLCCIALFSCDSKAQDKTEAKVYSVNKTEAEWKAELSDEQFYVLRKAGTERPFSSPLNKIYEPGTYVCAACNTPLFEGKDKFDSGTGWPSFDRSIGDNVAYEVDYNLGYGRNEEHCATCGGHLGHVFDDGPRDTTGKRHCINGDALIFKPKE